MLHQEYYVREKLSGLESRPAIPTWIAKPQAAPRRALVDPAVRGTGRLLRRLGEGLEAWAGLEPEPMLLERNPR